MPTISYPNFNTSNVEDNVCTGVNVDTMPADGWITEIAMWGRSSSSGETVPMRNCIYVGTTRQFLGASVSRGASPSNPLTQTCEVAVGASSTVRWGMGFGTGTGSGFPSFDLDASSGHTVNINESTNGPSPWSTTQSLSGQAIRGTLTYVANVAPTVGTPSAPINGATGVSLTPTFSGSLPHNGGDGAYDSTTSVNIVVTRVSDGATIYNANQAVSGSTFSLGIPVTLAGGTSYQWKYRHMDTFGLWSGYSSTFTFTTLQGPSVPTLVAPSGKINAISGFNYSAVYQHPTPLNANAVQILVKNAAGTTTLYDSGTVVISPTITSGTQRDTLEFHADLAWGTSYTWQARFRDTNNIWGDYASLQSFQTDAPPSPPTNLQPSGNVQSSNTILTCNLSDPDGDAVQLAQVEIVNATTGAVLAGFPKQMTVDTAAGTASYQASGDLVLGTQYKWRARGNDNLGPGYGSYSDYAFFGYVAGPTVTLLSPPSTRLNKIRQPSAEYDPATLTAYWAETARTGSDFVDRLADLNAAWGDAAWIGTASAAGDNRFKTDFETVDATKPWLFQVEAKRDSGTSAHHFAIECYNSSNTLVGTLYPSSIAAANAANVPQSWTRYGGIVWPIGSGNSPAFPATTTKVKVATTHSRASAAEVRTDAYFMEQLPTPASAADWLTLQAWYGYTDPDLGGYADGGYSWTADEGDSPSQVLSVVTDNPGSVLISYTSGVTKHSDRLIVERWTGSIWANVVDTGWVSSTRTLIPVPVNTFRNGQRYRVQVQARDTNLAVGQSAYSIVDVTMIGAPEPVLENVSEDPVTATISFAAAPTTLAEVDYGGLEVQREPVDGSEERITIARITTLGTTFVTDHYPASGKDYIYYFAQIKNVGIQQVTGRYLRVMASVDYSPFMFMKDCEDPSLLVAFETRADALGAPDEDALSMSSLSWGEEKRSHSFGRARLRSGTVLAEFFEDASVWGHPDALTRFKMARQIILRRNAVALLLQEPEQERLFVAIVGAAGKGFVPARLRNVSFSYEETNYAEDYYEREGWI